MVDQRHGILHDAVTSKYLGQISLLLIAAHANLTRMRLLLHRSTWVSNLLLFAVRFKDYDVGQALALELENEFHSV